MAISEQLPDVVTDQGQKATSRAKRATSKTGAASSDAAAGLAVSGEGTASTESARSFVIDTSVLLSDPRALLRFAEHEVILPIVVITELEGKRHDPELGYFARKALRLLDDLRVEHGGLDRPIPLGHDGGTLMVELNHISAEVLPAGFRGGGQRQPDPRRRQEPRQRGPRRHGGVQGPADARQGLGHGAAGRRVPQRTRQGLRLDRRRRDRRERGRGRHALRPRAGLHPGGGRDADQHRAWSSSPAAAPPWAGWAPTSRSASSRGTATSSGCTAARPNSGWRSTC